MKSIRSVEPTRRKLGAAVLSVLLLAPTLAGAEDTVDLGTWEADQRAIRAVAQPETHLYGLDLEAGELVVVTLDRRDVALVVTVTPPGGAAAARFGSTLTSQGSLTVDVEALAAGSHRIEVRAFPKPSGSYEISLARSSPQAGAASATLADKRCQEKRWRDQENHFLVDEAMLAVADCMDALAAKLSGSHADAVTIAAATRSDVEFVTGRWRWGDFVSPAYQESLLGDFRALASVAADSDGNAAYATLQAVAEDIAIKAEHCRNSPSTLGTDVVVAVKTRDQEQDVSGWLVWYKMKIQESLTGVEQRFPQPSGPETSHQLPPGMWLVWATKPGQEGAKAGPDVIRVGEGKELLPWTLIVDP